jgi:AsmA protein
MKRIARIFGIVIVLIIAAAITLPFLIDANQFRPALESRLSQALGREVKIGNLKVSLFSGGVAAKDLSIADAPAFGKTPLVRAQGVKIGVQIVPLIFSRQLNITGITIDHPQIDLVQTPAGAWNFSSIGAAPGAPTAAPSPASASEPAAAPRLSVASLKISDGRLSMRKTGAKNKPLILDNVNIEVRNFAADSSFPFSLSADVSGGGTIKLNGNAGPIDAGNAVATPFSAKLNVTGLDLLSSGIVDPSAGIAGLASIEGAVESARGVVGLTGKLKGERLKLAKNGTPATRPIEVDFAVSHNLIDQSGDVRRMTIHLGDAVANLTGTYRLDTEPATVNLKLAAQKIPLTELASFLPALDIVLPAGASIDKGTADVNLTSAGRLDKLVTTGTMSVADARLQKYDFASKVQVLHEFTGIKAQPHTEIQTLAANVKNSPEGTALDDIQLVIPSVGAISGAGTISPSHALDFKMHAAVRGTGGVAALASNGGVPFTIQGSSENPVIRPDLKGLVKGTLRGFSSGDGQSIKEKATGLLNGILGGKKKPQPQK